MRLHDLAESQGNDVVAFEIDSENAYNHVMDKFGNQIEWDGDTMLINRRFWSAVQELAYAAGGEATEVGDEQDVAEGSRIKTPSGMYRDQHTGVAYSKPTGQDGNDSYMTPAYMLDFYKKELARIAAGPYKRTKEVARLQAKIAKLEKQGVAEAGSDAHNYDSDIDYYNSFNKRKPERDPEDMPAPRLTRAQQAADDEDRISQQRQAAYAKFTKGREVKYVEQEGAAPNGKKYNRQYVIHAKDKATAEHEAYLFDKHEWGAKNIVDTAKEENADGTITYTLYIVDNHKYGMWKPWKDQPATESQTKGRSALRHAMEAVDADQKKAKQVPATEMPKKTSPVIGQKEKQHPFKGRAVGGN